MYMLHIETRPHELCTILSFISKMESNVPYSLTIQNLRHAIYFIAGSDKFDKCFIKVKRVSERSFRV